MSIGSLLAPARTVAPAGAQFRIVDAFGRNPKFYIDVTETVLRLNPAGMTLAGHPWVCRPRASTTTFPPKGTLA